MADTGKNSPLGVNVTGSILNNTGYAINPVAARYMGSSKTNNTYTFGSLVSGTALRMLTWAINEGYSRGQPKSVVPNGTTVGVASLITGCPYEILKLNNDTLTATATTAGDIYKIATIGSGSPVNAGSFVIGQSYGIKTVGSTDFTLIGASSNTVGVVFTATGIGSGSGDAFLNPTDFTLIGASSNTVDTVFTATGVGTGTGTVTYNSTLPVVAITPGKLYQIKTVGTTDFTLIGSANNTVGTIFTATGVGIGTGTVTGGITDFTKVGATKVTAGNFIAGEKYIIFTIGSTNFTSIGASGNTVGLIFTATGVGTGTGEAITVNFIATGTGTGTGTVSSVSTLTTTAYNNLISIGANTIPALGNAKPPTYSVEDPSGAWTAAAVMYGQQNAVAGGYNPDDVLPGPATTGYGNYDGSYGDALQGYGLIDQKQNATWYPYTGDSSVNTNTGITQWGWVRCHALQAWNEFNWNGDEVNQASPQYSDFTSSFTIASSYIDNANQAILAAHNSNSFLEDTYSNMDDLVTADISGISLSSKDFGTDLINLGNAFNIKKIDAFGLPSTLLEILGTNNAVTPDLSLALLASGLASDEINTLTSGSAQSITPEQERKAYGAFLIITGANLTEILAPLQCITQGLTSLADLLNVKKMFPLSYSSLTVPKYNATPGPTNSKTYYLIYENGAVNGALDTPDMREYVGIQVPKGTPPVYDRATTTVDPNNYGDLPIGFGAYARGIIPEDQVIAAGALSFTMRQIRKIDQVDFKKFAKIAQGMENMQNLPLTAGTNKPTNQESIDTSISKGALGSGPYGSFTMSDMFGCMSGLPYPWQNVYNSILQVETPELSRLYQELYLAVAWEPAKLQVQYTGSPGSYTVTGVTIVDNGGGYGRGGAPAPTITLSNGGTAVATIGTDSSAAGSNGTGSFGRVTTVVLTSPGSTSSSIPTATIQAPPTSTSGGTNTASGTTGWAATMSAVVQNYIDLANAEIVSILQSKSRPAQLLNEYWNILGTQLKIEQRARYSALTPAAVPKDVLLNPANTSSYSFVDSIPSLAQDTRPHMTAQTLEAISDLSTVGGQSTIGAMRQERNQRRLQILGIDLDNNIPDSLSDKEIKILTTNGVIAGAVPGTGVKFADTGIEFTCAAWPGTEINGVEVFPTPNGYFDPAGYSGEFLPTSSVKPGGIETILEGNPIPSVSTVVPAGPINVIETRVTAPIVQPPVELSPDNLPPNLNPNFTSSTLLPASPSIQDAIDQVIECNCDCWI